MLGVLAVLVMAALVVALVATMTTQRSAISRQGATITRQQNEVTKQAATIKAQRNEITTQIITIFNQRSLIATQRQQIAALHTAVTQQSAAAQQPSGSSPPSSIVQLATGILQAVINHDLPAVSQYYAPDQQPQSWDKVVGAQWKIGTQEKLIPDMSACRGASFTTTQRTLGVDYASVTFTFASNCAMALPLGDIYGGSTLQPDNHFVVDFEHSMGTWNVYDIPLKVSD